MNPITEEDKFKFLDVFRRTGNQTAAAEAVGRKYAAFYGLRQRDEAFSAAWDEARSEFVERAEAELVRRGIEGYRVPKFLQGKVVGHEVRYSDTCLVEWLRANCPEKYTRRQEITGDKGSPLIPENGDLEAARRIAFLLTNAVKEEEVVH